ncbi:MAG: DUF2339 domain-containing protein [Chitinophagaceae bacterium]|nr:DUF2339 domain-containing protein [Chitinophagaceae bacterium]
MDRDERIIELQGKINSLAQDINSYRQELQLLQRELNSLRGDETASQSWTAPPDRVERSPATDTQEGLENYLGLRFIHIIGIVVLVIGLSIGVKYAIDKQLISEGMRIALAYTAGVALYLLSVRLKKNYLLFSAILFSGSMASVYFTTYAAFVYYQFFPGAVAFALMTAFTVLTTISAISYNRQEIAILGMVGAYGIPFLVSANADKIGLFFSYILLINIGVTYISFRRSWRLMQYLALVTTWILFMGWAFMRYDGSDRLLGFAFISAYYILFFLSALSPRISHKQPLLPQEIQQIIVNNFALYLACLLIFGNGGFELAMTPVTGYMFLFSALLAFAATLVFPSEIILQRLIAWQSILLLVAFIGLEWDGLMVTLLWIAVAVVLFIWGIINKKSWPRLAGMLLVGFTLGKLLLFDTLNFSTIQKIISFLIIGILLLMFSFYYQKFNKQ